MRTIQIRRIFQQVNRAAALGLSLIVLLAAAAPAGAQDPAGGAAADVLRIDNGVISLRLDEAISIALERNLSLVVERYRRSESVLRLDESKGIYDINTRADLSVFDETNPAASNLDGAVRLGWTRAETDFGQAYYERFGLSVHANYRPLTR